MHLHSTFPPLARRFSPSAPQSSPLSKCTLVNHRTHMNHSWWYRCLPFTGTDYPHANSNIGCQQRQRPPQSTRVQCLREGELLRLCFEVKYMAWSTPFVHKPAWTMDAYVVCLYLLMRRHALNISLGTLIFTTIREMASSLLKDNWNYIRARLAR